MSRQISFITQRFFWLLHSLLSLPPPLSHYLSLSLCGEAVLLIGGEAAGERRCPIEAVKEILFRTFTISYSEAETLTLKV